MTPMELGQAKLSVGTRLREARIAKGITQAEFGKLAGTNQAIVQKIENGATPRPHMVDGLAFALDVNPAWLQWGEPFAVKQLDELLR